MKSEDIARVRWEKWADIHLTSIEHDLRMLAGLMHRIEIGDEYQARLTDALERIQKLENYRAAQAAQVAAGEVC